MVYLQVFSRTLAQGRKDCSLSYTDLCQITGLSRKSVQTAITKLCNNGFLVTTRRHNNKTGTSKCYEIQWPSEPHKLQRHRRNAALLLRETSANPYSGILDRLTSEDKELLNLMISGLDTIEESSLRKKAADETKSAGNATDRFLELVAIKKFGPNRLRKYERYE